jgi:hypothetical protein
LRPGRAAGHEHTCKEINAMKKALALSVLLGVAAGAPLAAQQSAPAQSQNAAMPELSKNDVDMAKLNQALTTKRRELYAQGMAGLSPAQQQTFWGIYADFEKEKDQNMSNRIGLLKRYEQGFAQLSDADIVKMANEANDIQKTSADIRMKYFKILNDKLGAKVAGRFYHVDDYLTTLMRLSILDNMPAIQVGQ